VANLGTLISPRGSTNIELPLQKYSEKLMQYAEANASVFETRTRLQEVVLTNQELLKGGLENPSDLSKCCLETSAALTELAALPKPVRHSFIMLTDGESNQGDLNMSRVSSRFVDSLRANFYFIGFGMEHSAKQLAELDDGRGDYIPITETKFEHCGKAAGDIVSRITYPWLKNVVFEAVDCELFNGLTNSWTTLLPYGSFQVEKKVELIFRPALTADTQTPTIRFWGTNPITGQQVTQTFQSSEIMSQEQFSKCRIYVETLQLLSRINQMNLGTLSSGFRLGATMQSFRGVFAECETLLKEIENRKQDIHDVGLLLDIEELTSSLQIVMSTMGRGPRSLIFSTLLYAEWFKQPVRIATVYPKDRTILEHGNAEFEEDVFGGCSMAPTSLGRQTSSNTTDVCYAAMRSCSQPASTTEDDYEAVDVNPTEMATKMQRL
jgi:hypothetical protein